MSIAELYTRAIQTVGPDELSRMFLGGVALLALSGVLLALGYLRVFARCLGILGVLVLMWLLWTLHEQTVIERPTPEVKITRPRYPEDVRELIEVALVALPAGAITVMSAVMAATIRRRRATVPELLNRGLQLYYHQHYDNALNELNQALKYAPENADAYFHRGRVFEAKGEVDQALSDFDRAIEFDPQNVAAYLFRGRIRTDRAQLDDALLDFERALSLRPNDAEVYLHRGVCQARKGLVSAAVVDFNRVLRLTNHTDFTIPAQEYLRLFGASAEAPPSLNPLASPSVTPPPPGLEPPDPPAPDWVI